MTNLIKESELKNIKWELSKMFTHLDSIPIHLLDDDLQKRFEKLFKDMQIISKQLNNVVCNFD